MSDMIDVREIGVHLRTDVDDSEAPSEIGRAMGIHSETFAAVPAPPGDEEPTDAAIASASGSARVPPTPRRTAPCAELAVLRARIEAWLNRTPPLSLWHLYDLLRSDHGLAVSYDTLRRFVHNELGGRQRRLTAGTDDAAPGEVAPVALDGGRLFFDDYIPFVYDEPVQPDVPAAPMLEPAVAGHSAADFDAMLWRFSDPVLHVVLEGRAARALCWGRAGRAPGSVTPCWSRVTESR